MALCLSALQRITLVVLCFMPDNAYLELQSPPLIIHHKWYNCQPLLPLLCRQILNFFAVQQEPARALGVVAFWGVLFLKGWYGGTNEKRLASANKYPRTHEGAPACAQALYLKTEQGKTALVCFKDFILQSSFFVFYQ